MTRTPPRILQVEPLSRDAFAPFGDVIERAGARQQRINQGTAIRFDDLARVDVARQDGRPAISIFRAQPRPAPVAIDGLERHPLGSQAFHPLAPHDWLVVVCSGEPAPEPAALRCFRATGAQGVNYRPGVWHHPLLVLRPQDFLVIDRNGPGDNLEEYRLDPADRAILDLSP